MTHDPMCPDREVMGGDWPPTGRCGMCDLIAKVREDEANKYLESGYAPWKDGYRQGQWDERERVKRSVNLIDSVEWALSPEAAVLAVIDGPQSVAPDDPKVYDGSEQRNDSRDVSDTAVEAFISAYQRPEHVDWCRDLACHGCVEITDEYDGQWHRDLYGGDGDAA